MKEINPEWVTRKAPHNLQKQAAFLESKGFAVIQQKENTIRLEKTMKFHSLLALFLFLCFVIPCIVYVLSYIKKRHHIIILHDEA